MTTFLFWNTAGQPLVDRLARIVASQAVDVVLLAECPADDAAVLGAINAASVPRFRCVRATAGLQIHSRLASTRWRLALEAPRWLIYRVEFGAVAEFLLVVAHLPSKLHTREHDQQLVARGLVADITAAEDRRAHQRTVLVGDLNMNPFEPGVVAADVLHGVMTRQLAGRETRVVQREERRLFYNPMWGLLGDRTPGPPGTFYRSAGEAVNYFWNTYDQVLLRPTLMEQVTDLRILDSDGVEPLLTPHGLPDAVNGSDHLPLLFRMDW